MQMVVYTRLQPDRGYLSALQLSTEFTSGYLNIVRDADIYYYPERVVVSRAPLGVEPVHT